MIENNQYEIQRSLKKDINFSAKSNGVQDKNDLSTISWMFQEK